MAFIETSDSIVIRATLTDEGKKLLARGDFKISKFALGDDEIDYELIDPLGISTSDGYLPALQNAKMFESYANRHKNIQFGLTSHDSGILYLTAKEHVDDSSHSHVMYLPFLKVNNKLSITPTLSGTVNYLSVNQETTQILNDITGSGFNFLRPDNYDACKIVIESGIEFPTGTGSPMLTYGDSSLAYSTPHSRERLLLQKFLVDNDYYVYCDDRFFRSIVGMHSDSEFKNFRSGETIIKFLSNDAISPVSLESEFENYATYILNGTQNLMFDFTEDGDVVEITSTLHSEFNGPKGSILACNPLINQQLRVSSNGTRDFRFNEYGRIDQILFSELSTKKFDYIDTTIYFVGATTNSRIRVPIRIVRYSGTT